MTTIETERADERHAESRVKRLRALTHDIHERLDRSLMAVSAFGTLEGYGRFVRMQYLFHREIDTLYADPRLDALLPDLADRRRFPLVARDLADLGLEAPQSDEPPVFAPGAIDAPTALGWLYVAEGSNLGAAVLRKEVAKIGLSDEHGARHLAPAPEGPAAHWRAFTMPLDAVELTPEEEARSVAGAQAAFTHVEALARACFD
jgi:heme oxygenase (biliverdin-IX-beta and delta-forming)